MEHEDDKPEYWEESRRPEETCCQSDSSIRPSANTGMKNSQRIIKIVIIIEKTVEHVSDDYANCKWCSWYSHQRTDTRTGGLRNNRMSGDHPNYSIIEVGQITEKSPGD